MREQFLLPGGAQLGPDGVRFRVWAPRTQDVRLVLEERTERSVRLQRETGGYFSTTVADAGAGTLYRFELDGKGPFPDPYSRFQPQGPHGPSQVVDPLAHHWNDAEWPGIAIQGQVLYEMHIGAFTSAGTFDSAVSELPYLADLGVTCLEIMPVAEFAGRFNWGYDAVGLYAPYHGYGDHAAFRRFVDAAHRCKLGVILDVVYNHLGAEGNYLACFSTDYFTDRYPNDWGKAINFDGPASGPVREFFIQNAAYWVREFHLDGLRLDATQSIHDASPLHVIAAVTAAARAAAAPRTIIIVGENEPQYSRLIEPPEAGGYGLDALWNDDFHHSARVALTGRHDGYFHDHRGRAQEFVSAVKYGFLFQGQHYGWQRKPRGSPALGLPAWSFIGFTQNHDQVANTFYGQRLHELTSPGRHRAMTALLLLAPHTPMLFMGQEFDASSIFTFFADHEPEQAPQVHQGRRDFLSQFAHYATPAAQARIPDPASPATFEASKLRASDRETGRPALDLHRDLLRIRREDPVIARQSRDSIDGAVLAERALLLRWFDPRHGDRLLLVNLGDEFELRPAPEPLLAPLRSARWQSVWSSDEPCYGGPGAIDPCGGSCWRVPGECTTLLRSIPNAGGTADGS